MPKTQLQAAIVDLDGTMVDTLGDFHAALARSLEELGWPPPPPQVVAGFIGKGSEHLVRSALVHVGAPACAYQAVFDGYQQAYRKVNGCWSAVYPGVVEGLRQLREAGLPLACLTNKPTEFARALLAAKGLDSLFAAVVGGDAFARKKPDPLPLRKTCEALGTAPAATLVVGDSVNDALAARAAGCPVVLVTYGYNHGQPVRAVDADGYLDSMEQLGRFVAAW